MKDIINYNSKYQHHGYQEWYNHGEMIHRGNWKNGITIGYSEFHGIRTTIYYII